MSYLEQPVDRYATPTPLTVTPHTPIPRIAELMRVNGIRHLPVVDDGRAVGIVSEREVNLLAGAAGLDALDASAAMRKPPYVVESGIPLLVVASRMAADRLGSAIIVKNGRPVGIFTTTDALRALVEVVSQLETGAMALDEAEPGREALRDFVT